MFQARTFPLTPSAHVFPGAPADEWWCDQVNGNDGNSGRALSAPLKTLAAVLAKPITGSSIVYLAGGSRWREELTGWPVGITIRAYGAGALPIIDGRDVAVNANFVKTGGRANVYEIAWSHSFDAGGGKCKHRAWENSVMLTRVADVATCDATAGSFYAADPTSGGPDTIYIHPNGNTNPITDGKSYEFSKRRWALQLYDSLNQAVVYGVDTIGNAHADGSCVIDGYVNGCSARDGRVHNFFVRGQAINCTATGVDQGEDYAMFVTYMQAGGVSPDGRNTAFRGCTADAGLTAVLGSGFYVHTDGTNQFGTVQYEDCRVVGCPTGWGGIQAATILNYRCTYSNVLNVYTAVGNTRSVVLGGTGTTRNALDAKALVFNGGSTFDLIVRGAKHYQPGTGIGPILIDAAGCTASITRCTYAAASEGVPQLKSGHFTWSNNILSAYNGASGNLILTIGKAASEPASFVANSNAYFRTGGNNAWVDAFTVSTYLTIANWRTALAGLGFGPETLSIEDVDPQLADPANGDFTVGNATVIALGAGAEPVEANDATLQALWNLYRVA